MPSWIIYISFILQVLNVILIPAMIIAIKVAKNINDRLEAHDIRLVKIETVHKLKKCEG